MKGYKFLYNNMRAPHVYDFIYELNKWYEIEDESKLKIYQWGYHFYKDLRDLFIGICSFNISDISLYEVEADGKILISITSSPNKDFIIDNYCSSKIKIVKKLEKEEIIKYIEDNDLVHDENEIVRESIAKYRYRLDILVHDDSTFVRNTMIKYIDDFTEIVKHELNSTTHTDLERKQELEDLSIHENAIVRVGVAALGYGLDKFVDDENWLVRMVVARQGYGLDKLIHDSEWCIRVEVVYQGYDLDVLINDPEPYVRAAVAKQGYGLDILIDDPEWYVRREVAFQGYGLDKLINDEKSVVRFAVKGYMKDVKPKNDNICTESNNN